MIYYSVIGTSWITESFIEGAKLCPDLTLLGIYSRTKEKGESFAQKTGATEIYTNLESLAASKSDFIYIASPNVCHYEQSKYLLEHGKNVICEKPITVTADEFRELFDIAERNGLIYFEAIMYMHTPARRVLKKALSEIGNISSAVIDYSQLSSKYPALKRGELPNIFNPVMKTGALNDLGIYCVYPVIDCFGLPEKITPTQFFLPTGADGSGAASFLYPDKIVTITYSKTGQSRGVSQFFGDEGTVAIASVSQMTEVALYNNKGEKTELVKDTEKRFLMRNEAQSMVNFIKEPNQHRSFYLECAEMSKKVISTMEKMRTETKVV